MLVTLNSLGIPLTEERHKNVLFALLQEQEALQKDLNIAMQQNFSGLQTPVGGQGSM